MTDPTEQFRAIIEAMTPGNLSETTYSDAFSDLRSDAEKAPVAIGLTREDAAGIIASVRFSRRLLTERATEDVALLLGDRFGASYSLKSLRRISSKIISALIAGAMTDA